LRRALRALIGLSVYVQGIDRRVDTIGGTQHVETTSGLRLDLQSAPPDSPIDERGSSCGTISAPRRRTEASVS